jgi:hypothetical protein
MVRVGNMKFINVAQKKYRSCTQYIRAYREKMKHEKRERNRFFLIFITLLIVLDFFMLCYQFDRSPLEIIPSWPVFDTRKEIQVFLPDLAGKGFVRETRLVAEAENVEAYVHTLVGFIVKGAQKENTRLAAPIRGTVRKIWLYNTICAIDMQLEVLDTNIPVIKGSEDNFRKAVEKTVTANIPSIKKVFILSKGIPEKAIWEL